MKQKDVIAMIVAGFVAGILSVILTNFLFSTKKLDAKVEVVEPISSQFNSQPDKTVFNEQAIDPTQLIQIGDKVNVGR